MARPTALPPSIRPRPGSVSTPPVRSSYLREYSSPLMYGWNVALREPRDDTRMAWVSAASKAIDTIHNSGFLGGGLQAAKVQMVGTGLAINLRPAAQAFPGWDVATVENWARDVETRFEAWASDPYSCDLGGRYTLGQLEGQVVDQFYATGEAVALLPMRIDRPGASHATKISVIPSSRLIQGGPKPGIVQGVEVDVDGMPVAYWFQMRDETERTGVMQDQRVEARTATGRAVVAHVFDGQPGTTRGITPLAPALRAVRQLDQLTDATLTNALIQAILAVSVESGAPTADVMRALQSQDEQDEGEELQPGMFDNLMDKRFGWYKKTQFDLGTFGKIIHTFPGEKLNFHAPANPSSAYEAMSRFLLREVARCIGVTYEQFTGDFVGATYSSINMGIADAWLMNLYRRAHIPAKFKQMAFEAWLEEDILLGNTQLAGGIEQFYAQRRLICRADWRGPPRPTADDLKRAKAQQIIRQEGWQPTEQLAAEYGNDHRDVIESQARTAALREENGLDPLPSSGAGQGGDPATLDGVTSAIEDGSGEDKAAARLRSRFRESLMAGDDDLDDALVSALVAGDAAEVNRLMLGGAV